MSRIRSTGTTVEVKVAKKLFKEGFRYRKNVKGMPGKPDLVLPKYKTVIFIHGCFWHRHENCKIATTPKSNVEFWQKKFTRNVANDKKACAELEKQGWNVIVLWECDINKHFDELIGKTISQLRETFALICGKGKSNPLEDNMAQVLQDMQGLQEIVQADDTSRTEQLPNESYAQAPKNNEPKMPPASKGGATSTRKAANAKEATKGKTNKPRRQSSQASRKARSTKRKTDSPDTPKPGKGSPPNDPDNRGQPVSTS